MKSVPNLYCVLLNMQEKQSTTDWWSEFRICKWNMSSHCCYRSMWIVATTFTMAINFWFSSHLWLAMLDPEVDLEHHWVEDHWPWRGYLLLYCACVQIQCGSPPSPLSVLWAWQLEHMWNQEWSYWPPITSGMWPVYSQWPWICRRCEFNVSCCFLLLFFLVSHNEFLITR